MTTPEQRRRLAAGLMASQYDRATPQDTTVTERAGLLPIGTYANGMTGLAFPGFLADPVKGFISEATNPVPYLDRSEDEKRRAVETGFDVAGAVMVGGLAAPKPTGIVGSAGGKLAGDMPHPWASLDVPPASTPFPHGIKREWAPGGERIEIYTPETKPYPSGGIRFQKLTGFTDEPLSSNTLQLKPRSDGSGEWVWPFTEQEEAIAKKFGARAAPDLYANGGKSGAAAGAALNALDNPPAGIRAYHGSPHDFDRFDMSKIGTGEGAQARPDVNEMLRMLGYLPR